MVYRRNIQKELEKHKKTIKINDEYQIWLDIHDIDDVLEDIADELQTDVEKIKKQINIKKETEENIAKDSIAKIKVKKHKKQIDKTHCTECYKNKNYIIKAGIKRNKEEVVEIRKCRNCEEEYKCILHPPRIIP